MSTPQPGILAIGTTAHHQLELDVRPGVTDDEVRAAVAALREPGVTTGGANVVVGFGAHLWRRLSPASSPAALVPFAGVTGPSGRGVPATPRDLWIWVHGTGFDVNLDVARLVRAALADVADLAAEQQCFVYRDSRDLTGFVDGTENPPVTEAPGVAFLPDGEVGAGGSFAITIRWVHDLAAFHALPVEEQERVIGRTKPDSVELPDDVRPPTAHISRVVIEEGGEELEIFRRSTPFGDTRELGLYFVAFSADPSRYDKMLARMFGTSGDGLHDRLTEFSTAVSGSTWFVPSLEDLEACSG